MDPCKDYTHKCTECTDAWELSRLYGCNEAPHPLSDLNDVEVGDCVEVNHGGERFWIQITAVCTCYVVGIVVSDLHFSHPFIKGDKIRVEIQQIYNHDKGCKTAPI